MQYSPKRYSGFYQSIFGPVFARMVEQNVAVEVMLLEKPKTSDYDFETMQVAHWSHERPPREDTVFDSKRNLWSDGSRNFWTCTVAIEDAASLQLKEQVVRWRGIRVGAMRWFVDHTGNPGTTIVYYGRRIVPNPAESRAMLERAKNREGALIDLDPREGFIQLEVGLNELELRDATWPDDFV